MRARGHIHLLALVLAGAALAGRRGLGALLVGACLAAACSGPPKATADAGPDAGCGADTCAACPSNCVANDACLAGTWQCACTCFDFDGGGGASCDAGTAPPPIQGCGYMDGGTSFPSFSDCCMSDSDCAFVANAYACCADVQAQGIDAAEVGSFYGYDARFFWGCDGCSSCDGGTGGRIATQDGNRVTSFAEVSVACVQSRCLTYATSMRICQPIGEPCDADSDCCAHANCVYAGGYGLPGTCCNETACYGP